MAAALFSFILMAVAGRELAGQISTFQILFFRSAIGVVLIGILIWMTGVSQLKTTRIKAHLGRNFAHFAGQYGWFYGLGVISLAEVIALEFTTPVWTAILAAIFLHERLTAARWMVLVFGIAGLFLILRPGAGVIHPAALAVLAGAAGYACSYIFTKSLSATETPLSILFYMTLLQLPLGFFPALADWKTPEGDQWLWVVVVGVSALTAHYCMTRAFRLADAGVVVPMDFLRLPLIAVVGYLFYNEALDLWVLLGAALMFSGNLINLRAELKRLRAH
ncbi:DMT family transporter [Thalassolituus sp. LLYu03]|uniref:DMT family transporter n=1 Tax=Thalassolituus sp. LLYu03 TaxID=3421656 RepID=UPI003D2C6AA3